MVGLVIDKGGETIIGMHASSGAHLQMNPLHLPPADEWTERPVYIDGRHGQIEATQQLVNEVIGENPVRNQTMAGGGYELGYQSRPPHHESSRSPPPMLQQQQRPQPGHYGHNMQEQQQLGFFGHNMQQQQQQPGYYGSNMQQQQPGYYGSNMQQQQPGRNIQQQLQPQNYYDMLQQSPSYQASDGGCYGTSCDQSSYVPPNFKYFNYNQQSQPQKQQISDGYNYDPNFDALTIPELELINAGINFRAYSIISESTTKQEQHQVSTALPTEEITIIVKFSGRNIMVDINNMETVMSLKEKIHIIIGTPIERMSLFFSGREMEDDLHGLSEYGIQNSSVISMILKKTVISRSSMLPHLPSRVIHFAVKTPRSSLIEGAPACFTLQMKDTSFVCEMTQYVLTQKILPMNDYIFIHRQRLMKDWRTLRWHGVGDGDCLHIFIGSIHTPPE